MEGTSKSSNHKVPKKGPDPEIRSLQVHTALMQQSGPSSGETAVAKFQILHSCTAVLLYNNRMV